MTNDSANVITPNDAASIKRVLEASPWGVFTTNNITFLTCPWCQSMIPGSFTNAHELPSDVTPKSVHIAYHIDMARYIKSAGLRFP